jgi:hypothetical protein
MSLSWTHERRRPQPMRWETYERSTLRPVLTETEFETSRILLRFDAGLLDDRPPFLDLGHLQ